MFFAPSNLSGVGSMHCECIHTLPSWQNGPSHYDTVLINTDREFKGILGHDVGHVCLFFSFMYNDIGYPCTLIDWYDNVSNLPDKDTGMWIVQPIPDHSTIVHIGAILQCAHLIPTFGQNCVDCWCAKGAAAIIKGKRRGRIHSINPDGVIWGKCQSPGMGARSQGLNGDSGTGWVRQHGGKWG